MLLGLVLIEAIAAIGLWVVGPPRKHIPHVQYDEELGWINRPSLAIEDFYGPGLSFTTNSRGFRGTPELTVAAPEGKIRVLCSGDSFTLGHGVSDADSWPARMQALDARLETVNLAQAGYGVDQAYLLARRESSRIEHHVHLFAVICEDFYRGRYDNFLGNAKPVLQLDDGVLVAESPTRATRTRSSGALERWHTYRGLRRLLGAPPAEAEAVMPLSQAAKLAVDAVTMLAREESARRVRFVFVWLPTTADYLPDEHRDRLRATAQRSLRASEIEVVDLTGPLRRLSPEEADRLFHPVDIDAAPHFSVRGNLFAARALLDVCRPVSREPSGPARGLHSPSDGTR